MICNHEEANRSRHDGRYAALVPNRLAEASSAYLRQHADNPVDWWPWGRDALDEAVARDQPIFLSVGYAACHWCHVMAHESFEDPDVARLLNDNFVPVKVDREERPDVDALYMSATQLMSGHGGWPMSVFLTPDGRPFMAGTYYPPVDRHGQVGFSRLLSAINDAWANQRELIDRQADEVLVAVERDLHYADHLMISNASIDLATVRRTLRDELVDRVDDHGGFGDAPKFPRPSYVDALLEFDDAEALAAARRTLDAMSRGGMYDHLRGGFARYSVDAQWHVPHFEKMLCDQGLLARCYLRAARTFRAGNEWRDVALDTLHFVVNDLALDGGFASSLDADAGGVEGSHVTWTVDEVDQALRSAGLGHHLDAVVHRLRIAEPGEFEGRSIPRLDPAATFLAPTDLEPALEALRRAREQRVQPGRDDKVILEWNAMVASAMVTSGDDRFEARGLELLASLRRTHFMNGAWWRTDQCHAYATCADLAWLADAMLDAYEVTGEDHWTDGANQVVDYLLAHHWDGDVPTPTAPDVGRGIFSVSDLVVDLVVRPKDLFDGATPSGYSVACRALARLGLITGDVGRLVVAQRLVTLAEPIIRSHPGAVPDLVEAAGFALEGIEVVVPGPRNRLSEHLRSKAMSRVVLITGSGSSPLLAGRTAGRAYVCRAGVCQLPVDDVDQLDRQLLELGA